MCKSQKYYLLLFQGLSHCKLQFVTKIYLQLMKDNIIKRKDTTFKITQIWKNTPLCKKLTFCQCLVSFKSLISSFQSCLFFLFDICNQSYRSLTKKWSQLGALYIHTYIFHTSYSNYSMSPPQRQITKSRIIYEQQTIMATSHIYRRSEKMFHTRICRKMHLHVFCFI